MSEIPEDIRHAAKRAWSFTTSALPADIDDIAKAILAERERCVAVARSIMPHTTGELHLIETIVRRIRGDE